MMLQAGHKDDDALQAACVQAEILTRNSYTTMKNHSLLPGLTPLPDTHPRIYSFRCSRGMDECLSRLMQERGLNRSSVIRLALYALDCLLRRQEVAALPLAELVVQLEALAPEARVSFADFIRGATPPATGAACGGWILPAEAFQAPLR